MVHVPTWPLDPMIYFPSSGLAFLRRHVQLSNDIARRLIRSRFPESSDLDKKDAPSRIGIYICDHFRLPTLTGTSVIANRFEAKRWRLTDDELALQLWWVP